MKKSRIEILSFFNKSKSGKSYLQIVGDQMYLISEAIMAMVIAGDVESLTFEKDGELLGTVLADPAVPGVFKKEFDTLRPNKIEESAIAKLAKANAIIEKAAGVDQAALKAALEIADSITF
jgi:hypothetical protein